MVFWAEWFARFHCEAPHYVPYELKTLDCPLLGAAGLPLLGQDGQPRLLRCVREIAHRVGSGEAEWLLISWLVGLPGVLFKACASLAEARREFEAAAEPVELPDDVTARFSL